MRRLVCLCLFLACAPLCGADPKDVRALLGKEIIGPRQARLDVTEFVRARLPKLRPAGSAEEWTKEADRLRAEVLDRVVFRGAAKPWRDFKTNVKWLETIDGGPGYRIKKLRYEALPGLWVPALLYEPEKLAGKVPVMLAVNGHDGAGKAAPYKQERCINLAKRGMLALNVEWVGMGQLRGAGYRHGCMNQLDLCGGSGLAVFYLVMNRGIDVLLTLPNTDPARVGVSGLSGGGWQTIFLSALDPRVTLSNPVAGYSAFATRLEHYKDLGDSEQTPCDLATLADYTHLTAMLAPRPTLLTYNAKDNCCFESGYSLPPLENAARPLFKLFGKETSLRTHVNHDPGDHNFGKDNREALYRLIGAHWFPDSKSFDAREIDSRKEIRRGDELAVELPTPNADFNSLARDLMKDLPRDGSLPTTRAAAEKWQENGRKRLKELLRPWKPADRTVTKEGEEQKEGVKAVYWKVQLHDAPNRAVWNVPVVELHPAKVTGTTLLLGDGGRKGLHDHAARLLAKGRRVVAVDPFYNGEASIDQKAFLFALMVTTVGERPLGLKAVQLGEVAAWLRGREGIRELEVEAVGPRAGVTALATAGLLPTRFDAVVLHEPLGSLKEIIEKNATFDQLPELFCYGLLEQFDVKQLAALVAPRSLRVVGAGERARGELGDLKKWYGTLGKDVDPLAE